MNSRDIIKKIKAAGWEHVRTKGDHWTFVHDKKQLIVTVPHPKKDLPIGLIKNIEKISGVKLK